MADLHLQVALDIVPWTKMIVKTSKIPFPGETVAVVCCNGSVASIVVMRVYHTSTNNFVEGTWKDGVLDEYIGKEVSIPLEVDCQYDDPILEGDKVFCRNCGERLA